MHSVFPVSRSGWVGVITLSVPCSFSEEIQPPECCSASSLSLLLLPPPTGHPTVPGADPRSRRSISVLPRTSSNVCAWHASILSEEAQCEGFSWLQPCCWSASRWMWARAWLWMHRHKCSCRWGANGWGCRCCPAVCLWDASGRPPRCRARTPGLHAVPLCLWEPSFHPPPTPCWGQKHICCWGNNSGFTKMSSHSQNETRDEVILL